ncbi:lycopene cyclase [Microlunatus endophyticus]|uniref:Lycopene cyclase n=1 Tax=Microlunatus endophyticus TaxID=1716077 RepID=A0A917W2N3_9ACTN|nr:lycopene cyclase domain-containing protein [Microlunatus endophyticus]GGL61826.1 lycopene cyclase [Microlunatus endophyticus]
MLIIVAGHLQYLSLLALCVLVTLPLEIFLGARVYRRPGRLLITLLPVVVIFSAWDVVGVVGDHWSYNPAYITGLRIFGVLPIEELAFFVVIPLCGLLAYSVLGRLLPRRTPSRRGGTSVPDA